MGYSEPRTEQLNGKWRSYTCRECGNRYKVLTVAPVPPELQICAGCYHDATTLKAYANAIGAMITNNKEGNQMTLQPFVIAGKAKTVRRLIDIKAKRETLKPCPLDAEARCDVPEDLPCAKFGCKVWLDSTTKANEEGI